MGMFTWTMVACGLALVMFGISWLVRFGRRLAMQPRSWEPNSKSEFRRRIGFIDPPPDALRRVGMAVQQMKLTESEQLTLRARREQFVARIEATTERAEPDRRIKPWPHLNAMEFRCRWTGRDWEPMPPMFAREGVWTEGVAVADDVEENRARANMRDDPDPTGADAMLVLTQTGAGADAMRVLTQTGE